MTPGTFSTNLSGLLADGFYPTSSTSAYNGFGQNGEYVLFDAPVLLNSLELRDFAGNTQATTLTAKLFNGATLLTSQTIDPNAGYQTLVFNTAGVTKLQLDFTGGADEYGDGRMAAWYEVNNITYSPVPIPAAAWLFGSGLLGLVGIARRKKV